jgi:hypothetical protein
MICGICGHDKIPGLFPPSEVKRVIKKRGVRRCISCLSGNRPKTGKRRGWAWLANPIALTQQMRGDQA